MGRIETDTPHERLYTLRQICRENLYQDKLPFLSQDRLREILLEDNPLDSFPLRVTVPPEDVKPVWENFHPS